MREATLKLKMSIQNVDITNNNIEVRRIILNAMLVTLGALALMYVLILGNAVLNIVQRKTLEKEMLALSAEVGSSELSYLAISDSIDMNLSSSMGFKEIPVSFATRKSLGSLSFNTNEI